MADNQGSLQLVARIDDLVATNLGDKVMGGDFVLQHGTGRDGLSSSGNRRDQLGIYNNGFVNDSYVYLLTVGKPVPPSVILGYTYSAGTLTLSWPSGFKLQTNPSLASTNWADVNVASPHSPSLRAQQAFYRLAPQ